MLNYDLIVIGFGKAGKTLAAKMNAAGKKVAVIERSKAMYGGTCINIACIPTKTMIVAAEKGWSFDDTMKERGAVTGRLKYYKTQMSAKCYNARTFQKNLRRAAGNGRPPRSIL